MSEQRRIPEHFFANNYEKSSDMCMFGIPVREMTRDDLIACLAHSVYREEGIVREHKKTREFLFSLMKRGVR